MSENRTVQVQITTNYNDGKASNIVTFPAVDIGSENVKFASRRVLQNILENGKQVLDSDDGVSYAYLLSDTVESICVQMIEND